MLRIVHLQDPVSYEEGLELQQNKVNEILEGKGEDTLFLLEHHPVYTIGRQRDQSSLRDSGGLPHPVFVTNRGGQATYHGPGQLVGYPILNLTKKGKDLHAHLRILEDILIESCLQFGVTARREDGLTGVWANGAKMASIGVGVRKWISMHGFALNITVESLKPFSAITPCGIQGVKMTSLSAEAGKPISVAAAADAIAGVAQTKLQ